MSSWKKRFFEKVILPFVLFLEAVVFGFWLLLIELSNGNPQKKGEEEK